MLTLSRKLGERICIGKDVEIEVVRITSGKVYLGIVAPREIQVDRKEWREKDSKETES